eukprot:7389818-Prymnesium_polylepis.2
MRPSSAAPTSSSTRKTSSPRSPSLRRPCRRAADCDAHTHEQQRRPPTGQPLERCRSTREELSDHPRHLRAHARSGARAQAVRARQPRECLQGAQGVRRGGGMLRGRARPREPRDA